MERLRVFFLLLVIGGAVAVAGSSGCMIDPVTGRKSLGVVNPSDDEEVREGRRYAASFTAEYDGAYPDEAASEHLSAIVRRIGALSHRPSLPFRFTLLNSSVPNAFALPGGEVFMTRGLLARLDEEAMFAVVMGHEVGHVSHRHSIKAMNDRLVVGLSGAILAGVIEDERNREIATGLAAAGGGLLLLRFSRDQELESDARGVEYAYKAGYDPRRGTKVFEEFARMKREAGGGGGGILERWTSSHPLDEDRIQHLAEEVARRYPALAGGAPAPDLVVDTPEYARILGSVREAQKRYDVLDRSRKAAAEALAAGDGRAAQRALEEIERAGAGLPGHALFPAVEGAILHRLGDRGRARERLERATALQPGLYFARVRLAAVEIDDGRHAAALPHATAAAEIVPDAPGPRMLLGRAYEGMRRTSEAVAAYEQALRLAASGSDDEKEATARLVALGALRAPAPPPAPTAPAPKGGARRGGR